MDRRSTPFSGRVADISLKSQVDAEAFVTPELRQVTGNPFLLAEPGGKRDRQLLTGDAFDLIEARGGWSFGRSVKDGYCGWLPSAVLVAPVVPTHWISVRSTWIHPEPSVRAPALADLHCTSRVRVLDTGGRWARVATGGMEGWVPASHLAPLDTPETDPTKILRAFSGTPYVWAGNTGFGIDCSGLIQAALLACGLPCPGDSDQQEKALGAPLQGAGNLRSCDLIFWTGHVAMLVDDTTLLHANGHSMDTRCEPVADALARIEAAGERLLSFRRL